MYDEWKRWCDDKKSKLRRRIARSIFYLIYILFDRNFDLFRQFACKLYERSSFIIINIKI